MINQKVFKFSTLLKKRLQTQIPEVAKELKQILKEHGDHKLDEVTISSAV